MDKVARVVIYFGFCAVFGYVTGRYFTGPIICKVGDVLLD